MCSKSCTAQLSQLGKISTRVVMPEIHRFRTIFASIVASLLAALTVTPFALGETNPNILFIAIDDMNDWTTLFDKNNPIQTPNLERLAARGAFFEKAYCASASFDAFYKL